MARITNAYHDDGGAAIGSVEETKTPARVVVPFDRGGLERPPSAGFCRPASSSSVNHGVHSQMSVNRMMPNALQRCTSHGWPSRPDRFPATTVDDAELVVEDPADHDRGPTTGATISGTSSTVCTSFCPRNGAV